ncbi:M48 family metallopeptidase [Mesohalobacter salilacus]|uniref:M48 family metallopeptidase n=1 Tax=Mesohalobacter salilacus TaxID=2491711 RepID=UPI0026A3D0B8
MSTKIQELRISDLSIDVEKKDIKNMHLSVYPPTGRIRISAPKDLNDEAIRLFAIGKISWIKKHQKSFLNQQRESPREYITGESHFFDGKRYLLKVIERNAKHEIKIKNKKYIELYIKPNTSITGKQKVFEEFYRTHLKQVVPEIISTWETKLQVNLNQWIVLKMRTKWGSCNEEKKKIMLNLELAKKPRHCLEYIIVHELIHLHERHHNDNFIALLDKYMPNWKTYKRELNELSIGV